MANDSNDPTDFSRFLERTEASKFKDALEVKDARVAGADEFEKMREHILSKLAGIDVPHSYMDESGQVWDCIPIEQQPSLRGSKDGPSKPPELPGREDGEERSCEDKDRPAALIDSQARPGVKDRFGNEMCCPAGTIPMRRRTLQELSRFETLQHSFQKTPDGGGHPGIAGASGLPGTHKHAVGLQTVDNLGGESYLNVWTPSINTGAGEQVSFSQQWYSAGSGGAQQTVECGWMVYPQMYGNTNANLFIYWTADGYDKIGGYNNDGNHFVQTNPIWWLGGYLRPVSIMGGTQYEMYFAFTLYQGDWWLFVHGENNRFDSVGYYPGSIFNGGQLATYATRIDYGGETSGTTSWPPMGSGEFANTGFRHAANQREINYFGRDGYPLEASLTTNETSPFCYTIDVTSSTGDWKEYFFFGGPGGDSC